MAKVGFIGLGNMGNPMVRNLAQAGNDVVLYDQNGEQLQTVARDIGARAATSAADFAGVEAIVTMLPTSKIVASALFDWDGGIPKHLASGTVVIDMSSSDPTETVELGARLREFAVDLVDAPVSGGVPKAAAGTLSIMLGTDSEAAADKAMPFIDSMSSKIFRTGKLGTGHAMKALNNFVAAASFTAACEALVAGERFGLEPQVMVDIFNASTGQSFVTTNFLAEHVVHKKFATGFGLALMTKDVAIARDLTAAMGHEAPVCSAVTSTLSDALEQLGPVDHSAAMKYWESR
ncbi:NAD(P)-dependent oxidoreductase [Pseudarthrobacter oxydans]|uniref:NAD(P)-dependent oxidoreductase n=1 Tax=Pseudarthrobacter oxydans TaxID=1671 RepID=UPI00380BAC2A